MQTNTKTIMALKVCKECNREYSDTLEACPHCGFVDSTKVTIFGYTESFAINPDVSIYKDDVQIASVSKSDKISLNITEPCELKFKSSMRTARCYVKPGDAVVLSFNRTTGGLSATVTSKENAATEINIKRGNDSTRIIWIIIICAILFGLSMSL